MTANLSIVNLKRVTNLYRIVESKIFLTLIEGVLMNPKMVLTVTGIFEVIFAIGIFFGAGDLASDGIPEISEQALFG